MNFKIKILLSLAFLICSCSKPAPNAPEKATSKKVILYNWKDYTSLSVLKEFENQTGIEVILKEFDTAEERIAKLQSDPHFCDLTVLTTHMANKQYMDLKLIQKIDKRKLNPVEYSTPFKNLGNLGTPYSYGTTGFAINTEYIKVDSLDYSFLTNPDFKAKVSLLDDPQDIFLVLLRSLNLSTTTIPSPEKLKKIEQHCYSLNENKVTVDDSYTNLDLLITGEKWIVQAYNGDAANIITDNPHIKFINPLEEIHLWSEIVCLTLNPPNKENAYKLLNFLNRPQNAAAFSNEFLYANGIKGSNSFLNTDTQNNPLVNISQEMMNKGEYYLFESQQNSHIQKLITILKSADQ